MSTAPEPAVERIYSDRRTCRACGHDGLQSVLDLGTQYLPRWVKEHDESLPKAPLHLGRCDSCGLLQLLHTVNPDLLYREFWYRSGINASMKRALAEVVTEGLRWHGTGKWLDIGANDGQLFATVPDNFKKHACEPALNFAPELEEKCDVVYPDYFSAENVKLEKFDVITSIACFYDVEDPSSFIRDIRTSLEQGGVWVNQLNDSPTMLKQNAFDAICHEHLVYWSVPGLAEVYERNGMTVVGLSYNDVNGGSVRITAKRTEDVRDMDRVSLLGVPHPSLDDCATFAQRIRKWKKVMRDLLAFKQGVWIYGASTKVSTLLQYLDMNDHFEAFADRNPKKVGLSLGGIRIADEEEFRGASPKYALVGPWSFRKEFVEREEEARMRGTTLLFPLPNPEFVL